MCRDNFEDHFSNFHHFSIFPRTFRIRGRIISKRQLTPLKPKSIMQISNFLQQFQHLSKFDSILLDVI